MKPFDRLCVTDVANTAVSSCGLADELIQCRQWRPYNSDSSFISSDTLISGEQMFYT